MYLSSSFAEAAQNYHKRNAMRKCKCYNKRYALGVVTNTVCHVIKASLISLS